MAEAPVCPHDPRLTPGACIECMNEGILVPPVRPEPVKALRFFTARFAGQCRACDLGIHVGQTIAEMSDESYRHEHCVRPRS